MIVIRSKRVGVNWRIQLLEYRIRILDFKNQLTYEIVFTNENVDINVYTYLSTVKKIKEYIKNLNIVKREMR